MSMGDLENDTTAAATSQFQASQQQRSTPPIVTDAADEDDGEKPIEKKRKGGSERKVRGINLALLQAYNDNFGDLKVPKSFIVPSTNEWPITTHGIKLGDYVSMLRRDLKAGLMKFAADDVNALMAMGFILDAYDRKDSNILLAIETYKNKHGNCDIVKHFKVEVGDLSWPEEVRGMNLGKILFKIRNYGLHAKIHENLNDIGVDLGKQRTVLDFDTIYDALVAYKRVHGHVKVPEKFEVPVNHPAYPERSWGMKLGKVLKNIRGKNSYSEHKDVLVELGVDFEVKGRK